DSHYAGAAEIGHGNDYISPHDDPVGGRAQAYLPDGLSQRRWYRPDLTDGQTTEEGSRDDS
ncbi:MAG: hypothetical protein ACPHGX_09250, partial [Ilumatobacteraceae bacterium]